MAFARPLLTLGLFVGANGKGRTLLRPASPVRHRYGRYAAARLVIRAQAGGGGALQQLAPHTRTKYRDLAEGCTGADVVALQTALSSAEFLPDSMVDGEFGPATVDAVQQWQEAHDLPANGIWDSGCREAFEREFRQPPASREASWSFARPGSQLPRPVSGFAASLGLGGGFSLLPVLLAASLALAALFVKSRGSSPSARPDEILPDQHVVGDGGYPADSGCNRSAGAGANGPVLTGTMHFPGGRTPGAGPGRTVYEFDAKGRTVGRAAEFTTDNPMETDISGGRAPSPGFSGVVYASSDARWTHRPQGNAALAAQQLQRLPAPSTTAVRPTAWGGDPGIARSPDGAPPGLDSSAFLRTEALRAEAAASRREAAARSQDVWQLQSKLEAMQKIMLAGPGAPPPRGAVAIGYAPSAADTDTGHMGSVAGDVRSRMTAVEAALAALPRRIERLAGMEERIGALELSLATRPPPLAAEAATAEAALAAVQSKLRALEATVASLATASPAVSAAAAGVTPHGAPEARVAALEAAVEAAAAAQRGDAGALHGRLGALAAALAAGATAGADLAAVEKRLAAVEAAAAVAASASAPPEVSAGGESLVHAILARLGLTGGGDRIAKLEQQQQRAGSGWEAAVGTLQGRVASLEPLLAAVAPRVEALEQGSAASLAALGEALSRLESSLAAATHGAAALTQLKAQVAALETALAAPAAPFRPTLHLVPPVAVPPTAPPVHAPAAFPVALPAVRCLNFAPGYKLCRTYLGLQDREKPLWRLETGTEVLLQAFHWESHKRGWYPHVSARVGDIAAAGFTGVWLPPASDSVAPQGYMPRDLYKLDASYGSEQQLRSLLRAVKAAGLHSIADIVINHRCATGQGHGGAWNRWHGVKMAWDERAICCSNPQFGGRGSRKQGDDFTAAPNVDHTQEFVRADLKEWLRWMRADVGFDSLRFDFTKGYDGTWVGEYVEAASPEFAVGEFWDTMGYSNGGLDYNQDAHRQRTVDWIDKAKARCASFDFTTKGILQQACGHGEWWRLVDKQGRPPGLLGLWPSRAVTFIDNHDTGSTQAHWPFPAAKVVVGYAYILTHPGMPMVMWDHFFDWGDDVRSRIKALIAARSQAGITSRTPVRIISASAESYVAQVGERLALRLGRGHWQPGAGWSCAASGDDYCVWLKN